MTTATGSPSSAASLARPVARCAGARGARRRRRRWSRPTGPSRRARRPGPASAACAVPFPARHRARVSGGVPGLPRAGPGPATCSDRPAPLMPGPAWMPHRAQSGHEDRKRASLALPPRSAARSACHPGRTRRPAGPLPPRPARPPRQPGAVRDLARLVGGQVPPRERRRGSVGQREHVAARPQARRGCGHASVVRADPGPAQRGQVAADAERGSRGRGLSPGCRCRWSR